MNNNKMQKCQGCKQSLSVNKFEDGMKRCRDCTNKRRTGKMCIEDGCETLASFGFESDGVKRWCKAHKDVSAIDLVHKTCEKCLKRANFGLESDRKKRWCSFHKTKEAIDLAHKKCEVEECDIIPSFGSDIDRIKKRCSAHKHSTDIDLVSKRCEYINCLKKANFGLVSEEKQRWCFEHKEKDAVDITHKKCKYPNCLTRASFREEGKPPEFCQKHKPSNFISVTNLKCEVEECKIQPSFGSSIDRIKKRCRKHKQLNDVDLVSPICEHCNKVCVFGSAIDGIKRRCFEHKKENDIDLHHRFCDECEIRATYGLIGTLPNKCAKHRIEGMYLNPKKKCMKKGCQELATHGCTRKQIHCALHKTENDIIVAEYKCNKCGNLDILDENGLCVMNCAYSTQNESFKKQEKKDEKRILSLLTREFGEPTSYDTIVPNSCKGRERPDIIYEFIEEKIRIIIEIDENGDNHGSDCSNLTKDENEINRMKNIYHSLAEAVPTVFIRYNPNSFYIDNIKQNISKTEKESVLIKWIQKLLKEPTDSLLRVLYLFYDQYTPSIAIPKKINITTNKFYQCKHCLSQCEYKRAPRQFLFYDKTEMKEHIQNEHTE